MGTSNGQFSIGVEAQHASVHFHVVPGGGPRRGSWALMPKGRGTGAPGRSSRMPSSSLPCPLSGRTRPMRKTIALLRLPHPRAWHLSHPAYTTACPHNDHQLRTLFASRVTIADKCRFVNGVSLQIPKNGPVLSGASRYAVIKCGPLAGAYCFWKLESERSEAAKGVRHDFGAASRSSHPCLHQAITQADQLVGLRDGLVEVV